MHVMIISDPSEKRRIAQEILADLPEWFGIPESTAAYIRESAEQTFFAAMTENGEAAGFMTMKETSPYTAELAVCGVKKRLHRCGAGRAMFGAMKTFAAARGYEYLQVKTVAAGMYPEYDATRMFYERLGFRALEVFPTLWDEANPCLIMVMKL
ncbi:MAG: GNAT family N-acetyltransferase [Clostridia bacterium]|nr:GNAT family N-acetyltransferase [Clostridia bacterium]